MAAPKKNEFWKLRSKHGRDKLFESPELLWQEACRYFAWVEGNPLYETKAFAYQGEIITKELPKMRAMTMEQLCFYLHCSESYFRVFKSKLKEKESGQDFLTVINDIETIIRTQKFQGASADLLNANIISRDLGLADKSNVDVTTDLSQLSDEQLDIIAYKLLQNGKGK
jgi:hypothetical protein